VAPKPHIPLELKLGPFTVDEARTAGLSPTALRGKSWLRLSNGLYCWRELADDHWKLLSAWHRLSPEALFAGHTAAWLHGIDLDRPNVIEVIVPASSGTRSRPGVIVRRSKIATADVTTVRGLRATTVMRTLSDLCSRLESVEALALIDSALRLKLVDKTSVTRAARDCLRSLGALAEPAESPMETRLRWILMQAGLPRPQVQFDLTDQQGRFIGRADLYYPSARLVVEYDGLNHRDRLIQDNRRQNLILGAGYRLLRFTAADIRERRDAIASQVRTALSAGVAASARRPAAARR